MTLGRAARSGPEDQWVMGVPRGLGVPRGHLSWSGPAGPWVTRAQEGLEGPRGHLSREDTCHLVPLLKFGFKLPFPSYQLQWIQTV